MFYNQAQKNLLRVRNSDDDIIACKCSCVLYAFFYVYVYWLLFWPNNSTILCYFSKTASEHSVGRTKLYFGQCFMQATAKVTTAARKMYHRVSR